MSSHLRPGVVAAICAFLVASAVPADAQRRNGSGSGQQGGAGAAPRQSQEPAPSAAPRQEPAPSAAPRQGPGPSAAPRQGPGPSAGAPAPQNAGRGRAYPRGGPGYRPGYGPGYRPFYGYRGYYPFYGYRGFYPWYGYGGYYPSRYFGVGTWGWPYYYGSWPYAASGYSGDSGYGAGSGGSGLKIEFKPKSAEVYVDGRFAGIVDQYDGMFDKLALEAGEHEITIYQEGFRSVRQRLYLSEGSTLRMKGALEPLAPAEPNEPRPQAAAQQTWTEPQVQMTPQYREPEPQYPGAQPQYPGAQPQGPPPERQAPVSNPPLTGNSRFGQVAIRVQPADAEVLINGEVWRNPDGAERMLVYLSPGTHRVEIRKEGFDAFVTAVEIRRGEVTPLNVSLARF